MRVFNIFVSDETYRQLQLLKEYYDCAHIIDAIAKAISREYAREVSGHVINIDIVVTAEKDC